MAKKIDSKAGPSASKKTAKPTAAKPAAAAAKPKSTGKASTPAAPSAKAKPAAKKTPAAAANGKKPAAKSAAKSVRVPTAAAAPAAESEPAGAFFYFLAETIDPQVTRSQPSGEASDGVTRFAEFAAVRQHAIDYLVDLIDRCEVRLWQIKRADSLDALEELVREHEHPPLPAAGEETPCAPS